MVQEMSCVYFITGKQCLEIINGMILLSLGGFVVFCTEADRVLILQ